MGSLLDLLDLDSLSPQTELSTALVYADFDGEVATLSYGQLRDITETIYRSLAQLGVEEEAVFGLYLESNHLVPGVMMAIMRSNCLFAFLPINGMHSNHWTSIKTALNYIVCHKKHSDIVKREFGVENTRQMDDFIYGDQFVAIKVEDELYLRKLEYNQRIRRGGDGFAYLVSTSGTTGSPKLVLATHSSLSSNLVDLKQEFEVTPKDNVLVCSPLTFDPSLVDLFLGLCSRATVIVPDDYVRISAVKLAKVISKFRVTLMTATPSLMSRFTAKVIQSEVATSLRVLVIGGEPCPPPRLMATWLLNSKATIYNIYGVTEISCWASIYKVDLKEDIHRDDVPILGRDLMDTRVHLDDYQEITIETQSRACLVVDVMSKASCWSSCYKTGDIGVRDPDGKLYLKERKDSTMKINGKKVNLPEMRHSVNIRFMNEINDCALTLINWHQLSQVICVAVVFNDKSSDVRNVAQFMVEKYGNLCAFKVVKIYSIPVTSHGKVDLEKVKSLVTPKSRLCPKMAPNPVNFRDMFCRHINSLLGSPVDLSAIIDGDIKSIGFDSMAALQLAINLETEIGFHFPLLLDKLLNAKLNAAIEYVWESLASPEDAEEEGTNGTSIPVESTSRKEKPSHCLEVISRRDQKYTCYCPQKATDPVPNDAKKLKLTKRCLKIELDWKLDLYKCVDASILVVIKNHGDPLGYIGAHSGLFVCVHLFSGTIKWQIHLPDRIEASACTDYPFGDSVYVGSYDGAMYCLNANLGSIRWTFQTEGAIKSTPIYSMENNFLFVCSYDGFVYAITEGTDDAVQLAWKSKLSSGAIFSSPCISSHEDKLFVGSLSGKLACLRATDGTLVWSIGQLGPLFSSPLLTADNNLLIIGCVSNDTIVGINALNGDTLWSLKESLKRKGPLFSSPALNQERGIFCIGSHGSNMLWVDFKGNPVREEEASSPVYGTPFFGEKEKHRVAFSETRGKVHIFEGGHEEGEGAETGAVSAVFDQFQGEVYSSPILMGDHILIGCRDNFLYSLRIDSS